MPDPEPTFTLEHEEQTWRVQLTQGETEYAVYLTREGSGKISVSPFTQRGGAFSFKQSDPNLVLAIGRLLVAAARKAGATDV